MTETIHLGIAPSVGVEKQIINKNTNKWESLLLHLVVLTLLLPTAAQSCSAGLLVFTLLIPRGWRYIPKAHAIARMCRKLFQSLFFLWGILVLASLLQAWVHGDGLDFKAYMRLIGKQGVWGSFIITSFVYLQMKRSESFLIPRVLLAFSLSLLVYGLLQRYQGVDWVHGFQARLGANREAYGVYRVSGWMDHPLTFSFNLMLFSLLSFAHALWLWKKARLKDARFWFFETGILLLLLLLTDSRYPIMLTFLLLLLALAWEFPKLRKFLAVGTVLCGLVLWGLLAFLPSEYLGRWGELLDSRFTWEQRFDRIVFWKVNWLLFLEHPFIGTGLARYDVSLLDTYLHAGYTGLERKYNAHNIYLQTLADSGILGGVGLLILLTALGRLAFEVKKRFHHLGLVLVFLATIGGGLVQNHLRDTEYLFALWISMGLCLSWLIVHGGDPKLS